jgi:ArsR family transcriptional regulator
MLKRDADLKPPPPVLGDAAVDDGLAALLAETRALADRVRLSVLRILRNDSYGVLELCAILDVAQPALSHHLKILFEAGLVAKRREGSTIFYRRAPAQGEVRRACFSTIDAVPLTPDTLARVEQVHAERDRRSIAFFAQYATDFQARQALIADASVYVPNVLELLDRTDQTLSPATRIDVPKTALEIGPGDGALLRRLADRFSYVVGIDKEPAMLDRCAPIAAECANVRLLNRDFSALPSIARYRVIVAAMVIHHLASPARVFQYAERLLNDGGLFVVVELCRHAHSWVHEACGDLWLGFEPEELVAWADEAGLIHAESQFVAQRNGFQIQIHGFKKTAAQVS